MTCALWRPCWMTNRVRSHLQETHKLCIPRVLIQLVLLMLCWASTTKLLQKEARSTSWKSMHIVGIRCRRGILYSNEYFPSSRKIFHAFLWEMCDKTKPCVCNVLYEVTGPFENLPSIPKWFFTTSRGVETVVLWCLQVVRVTIQYIAKRPYQYFIALHFLMLSLTLLLVTSKSHRTRVNLGSCNLNY